MISRTRSALQYFQFQRSLRCTYANCDSLFSCGKYLHAMHGHRFYPQNSWYCISCISFICYNYECASLHHALWAVGLFRTSVLCCITDHMIIYLSIWSYPQAGLNVLKYPNSPAVSQRSLPTCILEQLNVILYTCK